MAHDSYLNSYLEQGCIYETEPSLGSSFNITKISSQNPYNPGDHCWAEFKCPNGFDVKYNFDYFDIYARGDCALDAMYLTSDNESFRWCGYAPGYNYRKNYNKILDFYTADF